MITEPCNDGVLLELAQGLSAEGIDGFTISPLDGSTPDSGYSVGGHPDCPEVRIGNLDQMPLDFLVEALRFYARAAWLYGDQWLGGWVHEGDLYLDAPTIFLDQEEAERVARERGEKAYFDLDTLTEHFVN